MKMERRQWMAVAMAAAALFAGGAAAQAYPEKTISLVVAYPPGGDSDATARLFAEKLSLRLKQPVIVDNRPGAGGTLGNTLVSRAKPDGYTLLFTPNPFTTAPMVLKLAPGSTYDPLKDFEPVILTAMQSVLLVTHPDTGIKSVADLVAQAKAGKPLTYASPGAGSPMHIAAEWLNRAAGIQVQHVPFRGVGPMIPDMLAGRVSMGYPTLGAVEQYLKSGKLVAVALTDGERSPLVPQLRTVAEQGYPDVKLGAWNGIFAPKGTPPAVVKLLNEHMNEILKMPDVIEKMATFGSRPVGGKPEALAKINADDYARLSKLIKDLNIQAD
ncbi:Bug family tripartite tricarboxylate transporter substrate binding protein [Hydrogenophaga sp. BPS33]|uniref:Bug family tripartite tricarboxylate transporter substrate binding protein n=1 Tax=Hydrogenophaga sp. BPS33 TaxID=2651974 RepID=UPI00131FE6B6|nr:tripartite tricarboxylate transporter substrate binding protein [Hydrogenophaga sp. BPS33]QHE85483.1 tripartite tricarboxylate transporter substrate binding protein [Hydrogenophaga sp. BPS33]